MTTCTERHCHASVDRYEFRGRVRNSAVREGRREGRASQTCCPKQEQEVSEDNKEDEAKQTQTALKKGGKKNDVIVQVVEPGMSWCDHRSSQYVKHQTTFQLPLYVRQISMKRLRTFRTMLLWLLMLRVT